MTNCESEFEVGDCVSSVGGKGEVVEVIDTTVSSNLAVTDDLDLLL